MKPPESQRWNPEQYARNARFVSDLGMAVAEWLLPQAGERILDLGCGDGALTIKLQHAGCRVVGVDSSPEMISAAKSLGLDARLVDARALPFNNEFDAVFSNAALHWMTNPAAVLEGVRRALRAGGRFVGEFGGQGNVATIVLALEAALSARGISVPLPWFFPTAERYQQLLEQHGFAVESITLFPRPTLLPGDMREWLQTFAQPYIASVPSEDASGLLSEVANHLRSDLCRDDGTWMVDYVRLRFLARKRS